MEKSAEAFRTISEVADLLETPAHVLRFWESRFPQIRPVKRAGGRRYYRPSDIALLTGIKRLLHDEGLTIRGVQKVLREQGIRYVADLHARADGTDRRHGLDDGRSIDPAADEADLGEDLSVAAEDETAGATILPFRAEPAAEAGETGGAVLPPEPGAAPDAASDAKAPAEPLPLWAALDRPGRETSPPAATPALSPQPAQAAPAEDDLWLAAHLRALPADLATARQAELALIRRRLSRLRDRVALALDLIRR